MTTKWWETAVFYQIYPRSFADGNGDGIGDLPGISSKLDYLQWLGVDAVWLSPHYPSPQVDVGYDIADYTAVEPDYGTLADFKKMLDGLHARGMKLILDLVLNHTSDQHAWFQESRASMDNPRRDWYVWRDGVDGGPPNNWESTFGGSAWTLDEQTGQYYYHFFLKEQPDLNWRNPEVKQAMFDAIRFWLDLGVDGFRLDAIGTIYEDPALTPHKSAYTAVDVLKRAWLHDEPEEGVKFRNMVEGLFKYQHDLPEVYDLMAEVRQVVEEYEDRFLVGETEDVRFLGDGNNMLHSVFNFDITFQKDLQPAVVRRIHEEWRAQVPAGAWQSNTLNNHDQSRVSTHFAPTPHKAQMQRICAALVLFLEGIPFLYYGEEIGMEDYAIRSFEELRDMVGAVYRDIRLEQGIPDEQILTELGKMSRDRCRTPMQWSGAANGGFSPAEVETWLPVHDCAGAGVNVDAQEADEESLLNFYRRMIRLRRENPALQTGVFRDLAPESERALVFLREEADQRCLIALNFSAEAVDVDAAVSGTVLYGDGRPRNLSGSRLQLAPFEILILEVVE